MSDYLVMKISMDFEIGIPIKLMLNKKTYVHYYSEMSHKVAFSSLQKHLQNL